MDYVLLAATQSILIILAFFAGAFLTAFVHDRTSRRLDILPSKPPPSKVISVPSEAAEALASIRREKEILGEIAEEDPNGLMKRASSQLYG